MTIVPLPSQALSTLQSLSWLNLSENELSGKGIRGILLLSRLSFLNLGHNRIKLIPDFAFVQLTQLKCLVLNNNQISNVAFLSDLPELNTLILSHNCIASIPEKSLENCVNLRKLNLWV